MKKSHDLPLFLSKERSRYIGSIVLGLNDALVELTGALAGLSFALRNTKVIALVGLITGISGALSMAASQYLSKASEDDHHAVRMAFHTGAAYLVTIILLVTPFLVFADYRWALPSTFVIALVIIILFSYEVSRAKKTSFKKKVIRMASVSLSVAFISFLIGLLLRRVLDLPEYF